MKWPLVFWFALASVCIARAGDRLDRALSHVPEESALIIVAPSLDKLVSGLAEFGGSIGVERLRTLGPAKLLSELDVLERINGLDPAGPLVIALEPTRLSPLLVCQVLDAEEWRTASGAQPADGELWRVQMFGEPAYAASAGNLLIVGDEPDAVRSALRGSFDYAARFGPRARAWLSDHQLVVAIRVPPWTGLISPMLGAGRTSLQLSMMLAGQRDENLLRVVGWLFEQAEQLLGQVDTYTAAVRIDSAGVFFRDALSFAPDSAAAAYLKKVIKTDRDLLRGLVDDETVFVFAHEWELEPGTEGLNTAVVAALLGSGTLRERLGEEKFLPGYEALLAAYNDISGSCTAVSARPAEPLLVFSAVQFSSRPQQVLSNMRLAYETMPEFLSALGGGASADVTCRAERIESIDAFACEVSFAAPDEQSRRAIEMLYGRTLTTYYAAQPVGLVSATASAERAAAQLVRMTSGKGRPLAENPRVRQVWARLSPRPQVLLLLDAAQALDLVLRADRSGRTGTTAPAPDTSLPLVAYGGYLDGRTLCSELCVPAEAAKQIVKTIRSQKDAARGPGRQP